MKNTTFQKDKIYHFFNRGNNKENIFIEEENYQYFLGLYHKYLAEFVDVYSYCLLPNHFHFVFKIRCLNRPTRFSKLTRPTRFSKPSRSEEDEILKPSRFKEEANRPSRFLKPTRSGSEPKFETINKQRTDLSQAISNLFNAYTKAINKKYSRRGSLFQKHPKKVELLDIEQLQNVILYVNTNSNHHNIGEYETYKYSSYLAIVSNKKTLINRAKVLSFFDTKENFIYNCKNKKIDIKNREF